MDDQTLEKVFHAGDSACKDNRFEYLKEQFEYYASELNKAGIIKMHSGAHILRVTKNIPKQINSNALFGYGIPVWKLRVSEWGEIYVLSVLTSLNV